MVLNLSLFSKKILELVFLEATVLVEPERVGVGSSFIGCSVKDLREMAKSHRIRKYMYYNLPTMDLVCALTQLKASGNATTLSGSTNVWFRKKISGYITCYQVLEEEKN